jgi:hypothetical protein
MTISGLPERREEKKPAGGGGKKPAADGGKKPAARR